MRGAKKAQLLCVQMMRMVTDLFARLENNSVTFVPLMSVISHVACPVFLFDPERSFIVRVVRPNDIVIEF